MKTITTINNSNDVAIRAKHIVDEACDIVESVLLQKGLIYYINTVVKMTQCNILNSI